MCFGAPATRCYSGGNYGHVYYVVVDGKAGCSGQPGEGLAKALTVAVFAGRAWDPNGWRAMTAPCVERCLLYGSCSSPQQGALEFKLEG